MKTRAELKAMAKEQLKGKLGAILLIELLVALGMSTFLFLTPALSIGLAGAYLAVVAGEKPCLGKVFDQIDDFWRSFKVVFLSNLYLILWSLLIIPGIVKFFSYSQAARIAKENPDITATEAITRSRAMMNGHKMQLFMLGLSFIGWILVGALTLGIAMFWIAPYINTTMANFYNEIKAAPVAEEAAAE